MTKHGRERLFVIMSIDMFLTYLGVEEYLEDLQASVAAEAVVASVEDQQAFQSALHLHIQ